MKAQKAVILEKSGTLCTILTADGSFRTMRSSSAAEVGEEIEIKNGGGGLRDGWGGFSVWASAAVLLFLILTGIWHFGFSRTEVPVALLSVDINPSLELKLNAGDRVIQAIALNQDAESLLKNLSYKGRSSQEVLGEIVGRAVKLHFLNKEHPWVLLGLAPVAGRTQSLTGFDLSGLVDQLSVQTDGQGTTVHLAAFQLTGDQQQKAQAQGLTPGQYALWVSAEKAGFSLSAHALSDPAERDRLLSEPKVQAETGSWGGILKMGEAVPAQGKGQGTSNQGQGRSTPSRSMPDRGLSMSTQGRSRSTQGRSGSSQEPSEKRPAGRSVPAAEKGTGAKGSAEREKGSEKHKKQEDGQSGMAPSQTEIAPALQSFLSESEAGLRTENHEHE